jgi:hypothetical protein
MTAADFEMPISCAGHLSDFCGVCSNLHTVSPSSSSVSTRHFLAGSLSVSDPVNLNILLQLWMHLMLVLDHTDTYNNQYLT